MNMMLKRMVLKMDRIVECPQCHSNIELGQYGFAECDCCGYEYDITNDGFHGCYDYTSYCEMTV